MNKKDAEEPWGGAQVMDQIKDECDLEEAPLVDVRAMRNRYELGLQQLKSQTKLIHVSRAFSLCLAFRLTACTPR